MTKEGQNYVLTDSVKKLSTRQKFKNKVKSLD
jgi:hypothetical protein